MKPLVQNSIQQNFLPEVYPLCSQSYRKCFPSFHFACCPYHIWTVLLLPPNLLFTENPVDGWGGRIPPHFSHWKNPLHQIAIFMHSPNTSFIYSCSHCWCIIALISGFMYRYLMLILINQWLLNLVCSMKKTMSGQNSSKQNSQPFPHPFNAIWKILLYHVFLFTLSLFHFKLYKFLLAPFQF